MSKRSRNGETAKPRKRFKADDSHEGHVVEEVHFARQLQDLLSFQQDGIERLRNGIASFKAFLERILYHKQDDDHGRHLSILREFLDTQKPVDVVATSAESDRPFLHQLWQAWSFASQNHHERLTSAVSSIFALLLKTLAGLLDFREYGVLLGRTVLLGAHLRLVKRGLDAPRHKEFLTSPCIRLLIEVVAFDGGVLARELYKRRDQTFDAQTLRRHLGRLRTDVPEEELHRRPAIRTLTIRYITLHLKYLHEGAKIDILKSRSICAGLFHHLRDDPTDVINELLHTTERHVLKDDELPRSAKSALLTPTNLERVMDVATRAPDKEAAAPTALAWLKAVCTTPSYGVLRHSGWYPPATTQIDALGADEEIIDLGLESIPFYDRNERPDVRNTTLLTWTQTLRPQTNTDERDLLLACFASAPELVAAYFAEKELQLEPKLTNTWIGYASFLFEIIQLVVPTHFGHEKAWAAIPPQTSIVIESVLPKPLTQKLLTKCLNQSSRLVRFFAVRLLVLAFQKVSRVCSMLDEAAHTSPEHASLWREASTRTLAKFEQRCPAMQHVVSAFRRSSDDEGDVLQREAITRLLQLYYEALPTHAMEDPFDVSAALSVGLTRAEADAKRPGVSEIRALELSHLLEIATRSAGMRWFGKQGTLAFSPVASLLRQCLRTPGTAQLKELAGRVLVEHKIVSGPAGLDALLASLVDRQAGADLDRVYEFLDDCMSRLSRQPIKYLDAIEALGLQGGSHTGKPSLLVAVVLEQAPFLLQRGSCAATMEWIELFLCLLQMTGDSHETVVGRILTDMRRLDSWTAPTPSMDQAEALLSKIRTPDRSSAAPGQEAKAADSEAPQTPPFPDPPKDSDSRPVLARWAQKDLGTAFEDGDIAQLILCLCSQHTDIRAQAFVQLQRLGHRLSHSNLENQELIYVLIGELIETYERAILPGHEALPYLAGTFATRALAVQSEPTHFLYSKLNEFLNRGPEWRVSRLPSYWLSNTVLAPPEDDSAHWKEVGWVLSWLIDGLRGPSDLEILRKGGVFESVMSLYSSPAAPRQDGLKDNVVELLWRATMVPGGSTTLITRTGVLSWLDMVRPSRSGVEGALRRRLLETCDEVKVQGWSGLAGGVV